MSNCPRVTGSDPMDQTVIDYDAAHRPLSQRTPRAPGAPEGTRTTWAYTGEVVNETGAGFHGVTPAEDPSGEDMRQ